MTDGRSNPVNMPARPGRRWTSFVGARSRSEKIRALQQEDNPNHRVRVEYSQDTLLIHISGEDGPGWTTVAIDRPTREWSVAQRRTQAEAVTTAYNNLYDSVE